MDAAGIAITLCSLCIDGYRSFQSLRSLGTDAQVILAKIEIQEYRLQHLRRGLENIAQTEEGKSDLDLVKQPVHNTLHSIRLLTTDAKYLRDQYKLNLEVPSFLYLDEWVTERGEVGCGDEKKTCDRQPQEQRSIIKLGKLGSRHPKVFKWLLFDKANLEKVATELKDLTDGLESLLALMGRSGYHGGRHRRSTSATSLLGATIASLAASDTLEALGTIVAASVDEYPELAADAERKRERLVLEDGCGGASSPTAMSPRPGTNLFKPSDFSSSQACNDDVDDVQSGARQQQQQHHHQQREMVLHKSGSGRELLLVEWRPVPIDFEGRERTLARLTTTAMLLQVTPRPEEMHTLDCPGYVIDSEADAAALVYSFPKGASRQAPISLLRLLKDAVTSGNTKGGESGKGVQRAADIWRRQHPPLEDRFNLALALAETVFRLHMSGWLHRCIGAHNVLFFGGGEEAGSADERESKVNGLGEPFLTGFGFSREDVDVAVTETVLEEPSIGRYRHPGCQGPFRGGFKAKHDLYSLGMVLLEIGLWKPFDRPPLYNTSIPAWENKNNIIRRHLSGSLAHHTGSLYEDIVRACLNGDFGCDLSDDAARQQRVYDIVLEPLKRLVDGFSSNSTS